MWCSRRINRRGRGRNRTNKIESRKRYRRITVIGNMDGREGKLGVKNGV